MVAERVEIRLEISEEMKKGVYSNFIAITHSPFDFILDFAQVMMTPGEPPQKALVNARVVMSPQHAKSLCNALKENIVKYEKQFGEIRTPVKEKPNETFIR